MRAGRADARYCGEIAPDTASVLRRTSVGAREERLSSTLTVHVVAVFVDVGADDVRRFRRHLDGALPVELVLQRCLRLWSVPELHEWLVVQVGVTDIERSEAAQSGSANPRKLQDNVRTSSILAAGDTVVFYWGKCVAGVEFLVAAPLLGI